MGSRPFAVPSLQGSHQPLTQDDPDNEAFNQHKFEAFGLQLKQRSGTITPLEHERLGALQAKMDDFWAQKVQRATQPNSLLARMSIFAPRVSTQEPAIAPVSPTPDLVIQRTLWQADEELQWVALDETDTATPPIHEPQAVGELFDDESNQTYASQEEYERLALSSTVMSTTDLPDEEDDSEYLEEEGEETSDESDDDVDMDEDKTSSTATDEELTLDTRKEEDQKALKRPRETSTMTPSQANYARKTITTNVKLKRKGTNTIEQRSSDSGPVTITLETVELWVNDKKAEYVRPVEIVGLVEPTVTTGRGGAPDPLSGTQIYMGNQGQLKGSIPSERNMGMPDAERGHIMALELGGPDIPENIVPQWAKFQGSGEWRQMEVSVLKRAQQLPKTEKLKYHVIVFYKETGEITPTIRSFGVPSGFRAAVQVCDSQGKPFKPEEIVFDQAQAQDITDTMLAEREMFKLDSSDWDKSLDTGKAKKTAGSRLNKRQKTTAKTPKGGVTKPRRNQSKSQKKSSRKKK